MIVIKKNKSTLNKYFVCELRKKWWKLSMWRNTWPRSPRSASSTMTGSALFRPLKNGTMLNQFYDFSFLLLTYAQDSIVLNGVLFCFFTKLLFFSPCSAFDLIFRFSLSSPTAVCFYKHFIVLTPQKLC